MKVKNPHLNVTAKRRRRQSDMVLSAVSLLALALTFQGCGDWFHEPLFPSAAYKALKAQYHAYLAVEPSDEVKKQITHAFVKDRWVPGKMVLLLKETSEASIWSSEHWIIQALFDSPKEAKVLQYDLLAKQPAEVTCVLFAFRRDNHDVDVHIVDIKTKEVVAFTNFKGAYQPSTSWAPGYHTGGERMITWEADILPWLNQLASAAGLEKKSP